MGTAPSHPVVRLSGTRQQDDATWLTELTADAMSAAASSDRITAAGELAVRLGPRIPRPGEGRTRELWEALATLGSVDLTVARTIEPHLDALTILAEAEGAPRVPAGLLGVYAAEGPGARLTARSATGAPAEDSWLLTGTKPWCSLADRVGGFLVTAWVDDEQRGLFVVDRAAVAASDGSLAVDATPWHARGLSDVRSTATTYEAVPAMPVGPPGWYLRRPGFTWGGMGVAAVWFGAAVAVARRVAQHAAQRSPDQIALMHVGRTEAAVHRARCVLDAAARAVDDGDAHGTAGARLALIVRHTVRHAAEEILTDAAHAMGPAPLVAEEDHARRVADLEVYLRQEHAERDASALGRAVLADSSSMAVAT